MTIEDLDPTAIDGELIRVGITNLTPAIDNPRRDLGDLADLTASIKTIGIIHAPVVTAGPDDDTWTIVAGHRRVAAARKAGLREIDCVVRANLSDADRIEAMALENLQREDLKPTEVAAAFASLVSLGLNQREVAAKVRRTQPHVSRYIKLLDLPEPARQAVDTGRMTIEIAVELTKLDNATVKKLVGRGGPISEYSVQHAVSSAATKRKRDRLSKPLKTRGLRYLASVPYGKWEKCTDAKATAFSFEYYNDAVVFYKEKAGAATTSNGSTSPATPISPPKETAAQKRRRLAEEKRAVEHRTALRQIVANEHNKLWQLIAVWMFDLTEGDMAVEEVADLLDVLDLAPPIHADGAPSWDIDWGDAKNRLDAYLCTDDEHARRFAVACAAIVGTWGDSAPGETLRLCSIVGYSLDKTERGKVNRWGQRCHDAAQRGYTVANAATCRICGCTEDNACEGGCSWVPDPLHAGEVCSSCLDDVGTIRDPEAATGRAADAARARADSDFADANNLQPGDFVNDDNTITRADA